MDAWTPSSPGSAFGQIGDNLVQQFNDAADESRFEPSELVNARVRAQEGNPFLLIGMLWPELKCNETEKKQLDFDLKLDFFQVDLLKCCFDTQHDEIFVKGATGVGKGASIGIAAALWYYIWPDGVVILTSETYDHAEDVIWAETSRWISNSIHPFPGKLLTTEMHGNSKHYIKIANPDKEEGFSGHHSDHVMIVFDEACYDDRTEVLTNTGWKLFENIGDRDYLLSMDPKTDEVEWKKPVSLHVYPRKGKMWHYKTKGVDICVTPNHSMLYHSGCKGRLRLAPFNELSSGNAYFPRTVKWHGEEPLFYEIPRLVGPRKTWQEKYVDIGDFAEFAGWYCSEGHLYKSASGNMAGVGITQKDEKTRERIIKLIRSLGYEPSVSMAATTPQVLVNERRLSEHLLDICGHGCSKKRVPEFIKRSSKKTIERFLLSYREGDGYERSGGKRHVYYTSSKRMADDLQQLNLYLDRRTTLSVRPREKGKVFDGRVIVTKKTQYVVSSSQKTDVYFRKKHIKEIDYNGMIYCVSLPPYHTMLTRRNGCVVWSGNTAVANSRFDLAHTQADKIIAAANPRILSGWFRYGFPGKPPECDKTQTVEDGAIKRRVLTVDGKDVANVRHKEKIIPGQMDVKRYEIIKQNKDPRYVAMFAHGKFPKEDAERQVIMGSWLPRHLKAWEDAWSSGVGIPVEAFGLDVAASKDGDLTVLVPGGTTGMSRLHTWQHDDAMNTLGNILATATEQYGIDLKQGIHPVAVDVNGLGKPVSQRLAEQGVWVIPVHGSAPSGVDNKTYWNLRAEMYGELGLRLNPLGGWGDDPFAIENDTQLIEELTIVEKIYASDGIKFKLTPKDSRKKDEDTIKKKLGRSPDKADGLTLLYAAVRQLDTFIMRDVSHVQVAYTRDPARDNRTPEEIEEERKSMHPDVRDMLDFYAGRNGTRNTDDEIGPFRRKRRRTFQPYN